MEGGVEHWGPGWAPSRPPDSRPDGRDDGGMVWTLVKSLNSEGRISFSTTQNPSPVLKANHSLLVGFSHHERGP